MIKKMKLYCLLSLFLGVILLAGCGGGGGVSDVTAGLVAYYPFNGNTNDAVGNADASDIGAAISYTEDRFGEANKACSSLGNLESYISIYSNEIPLENSITFAVWINNTGGAGHNGNIIYCSSFGAYINGGAGTISFHVASNPELVIDGAISSNDWTHVVMTYDNATGVASLFIKGEFISNTTNNNLLASLNLGGLSFASWYGVMDDLRIYNRVLTASEIKQLYQYHNN